MVSKYYYQLLHSQYMTSLTEANNKINWIHWENVIAVSCGGAAMMAGLVVVKLMLKELNPAYTMVIVSI